MDEESRRKIVKILKELQLDTMAVQSVDKGDYDSDVEYLTAKLHWAEVQIEALIDSYGREARIEELKQAWDWAVLNNQTSIKGSWILKRVRKLKALGGKPEGKPNE